MARKVATPDRGEWRVGRQWVPFRLRLPGREPGFDVPDLGFDGFDDAGGLLSVLLAVVFVVVLFSLVWPVFAIALEVVVLVLAVLGGVAARVVLRRPWTVRAVSETGRVLTWQVVGWRDSGRLVDEVAGALREGRRPPAELMA